MTDYGPLIDAGRRDFHDGLDRVRLDSAGLTPHNAYLDTLHKLLRGELDRDQVCGYLAYASLELLDEQRLANRYWFAWCNARERAATARETVAAADDERDYLTEQLRDEESESRRLRLAWTSARRRAAQARHDRRVYAEALRRQDRELAELRARSVALADEVADVRGLVR